MKRPSFIVVSLLMATFLLVSCRNQTKPRTLYWSGVLALNDNDSTLDWSLYLGYYIEMSDTGETRLMTREKFKSPKEYYIINLPDSTKNEIFNLAMNDSMYLEQKPDTSDIILYDGYLDNLRVSCNTSDKSISFSYPKNKMQYRLEGIMDNIWRNPIIKSETYFDLTQYEINTKKWIVENSPKVQPPRIRKTIHFVPPKIKPDSDINANTEQLRDLDEKDTVIICQHMPYFKGGQNSLDRFIERNLRYPEDALEKDISGNVYVKCVIDVNGSITSICILRGLCPSIDAEAIRILKMMPKWQCGMQKGKRVNVSHTMVIRFKIHDKNK